MLAQAAWAVRWTLNAWAAMLEPVAAANLLAAAVSGALVVLAGAGYAIFFALSRLMGRAALLRWAYGCYVVLAAAVWGLADTLSLVGYWWLLVVAMLIGYLLAPHGIWHLCVATHARHEAA